MLQKNLRIPWQRVALRQACGACGASAASSGLGESQKMVAEKYGDFNGTVGISLWGN